MPRSPVLTHSPSRATEMLGTLEVQVVLGLSSAFGVEASPALHRPGAQGP